MGSMQAMGAAEAVVAGLWSVEDAVAWHLAHNHYPPVPQCMTPPAVEAVRAVAEEDAERLVSVAGCAVHKHYGVQVPAGVIVEGLHLAYYVEALWGEDGE